MALGIKQVIRVRLTVVGDGIGDTFLLNPGACFALPVLDYSGQPAAQTILVDKSVKASSVDIGPTIEGVGPDDVQVAVDTGVITIQWVDPLKMDAISVFDLNLWY